MIQSGNFRRHSDTTNKYRAFTLIELLIVIAIIAILASILFPVFARARENARRASCASNMKQVGLAVMQYVQDYDEHFPGGSRLKLISNFNAPASTPTVHGLLIPYIKSLGIFNCPSATNATGGNAPTALSSTSYFMNGVFLQFPSDTVDWWGSTDPNNVTGGKSVAVVPAPAEIVYMQEYGQRDNRGINRPTPGTSFSYNRFKGWCFYDTVTRTYGYSALHFDGGNLLFADGHVKWKKMTELRAKDFGLALDAAGTPVPADVSPSPTTCYSTTTGDPQYRSFF